jgi:putative ABC transport system permease protein
VPDWKEEIRVRLAQIQLAPTREAAIIEELSQHLEDIYEELLDAGEMPANAERLTRAELSENELLSRELCRVERLVEIEPIILGADRRSRMIADLWQDLRYGARMFLKEPSFTLIAVLTLAVGIGANTAIFSVVNAVLLRALPFASPERLVAIEAKRSTEGVGSGLLSYPDFTDFKQQNQSFERLAVYRSRGFTLVNENGAVRLRGTIASANLFAILGVNALLGRTFTPAEDQPGGGRTVILSHALWLNRFNGDANVIGQTVAINGESYAIIGVMPHAYQFPIEAEPVEIWVNFARDTENTGIGAISANRGNRYLNAIGQLKPGVRAAQAETHLVNIATQLSKQYPNENYDISVTVTPMLERLTGTSRRSLWIIFAAVGFVLLIACLNVAGLLLARALNRRREIAVRTALGANRFRLIRQLLTESVLLALLGGLAGILLAKYGMEALIAIAPGEIPRLREASLDGRVLIFTLSIAALTGIVMGMIPAWQSSRLDLQTMLKEGSRQLTGSRAALRSGLIIFQIALAVVLLIGAGLLIQSYARLVRVNPGFHAENLLTLRVGLSDGVYHKPEQVAGFHERLIDGLGGVPGVSAYSTVHPLPMMGSIQVGFSIEGQPRQPGRDFPHQTGLFLIGGNYFQTMGIPLKEGREYTARDGFYSTPVVMINEAFARRYFPDQNPLGRRINPAMSVDARPLPMREIIGVVADTRSKNLREAPEPEVYLHLPQCPSTSTFTLLMRTQSDAQNLTDFVREAVGRVDRNVPISHVRTFESHISSTLTQPRFNSLLLSIFASIALLLTAIGIYGVMAFAVTQRTQEIGLCLALGAQTRDIFRLYLGQGLKLVTIGVISGVGGALALTRIIKQLLYGVTATDPLTYLLISLLLIIVALLACYLPARRATRIDPLVALRDE